MELAREGVGGALMADRVFFVASTPDELFRGISMPVEMLDDLVKIAELPRATAERVSKALEAASGFLDEAGLREVVDADVTDQAAAESISRAIRSIRPDEVDQTITTLRKWREASPGREDLFPDASLKALETILPTLIRPFPALERQRKARRLESLTGNQVRKSEIVCDARPIFDSERRTIEGFVTQTILKIDYETQPEGSGRVELVLSTEQLKRLGETVEKAQRKLEVLRSVIKNWELDSTAGMLD